MRMRATRQRNTNIEVRLRRALWEAGARGYRLQRRPVAQLRRTADLVFIGKRVAVYVDGCFWHACPDHGTAAKANAQWWREKLAANRVRDEDTNRRLTEAGWTVVRVWEHENPAVSAAEIKRLLSDPTVMASTLRLFRPARGLSQPSAHRSQPRSTSRSVPS